MYAEVAWVLVSSETQVQSQIIVDPDSLPNYLSVSYDYDLRYSLAYLNDFFLLNRYALVQTNVNNNKTEIEIMQSQTKNKTSLPYYVYVMRHKI